MKFLSLVLFISTVVLAEPPQGIGFYCAGACIGWNKAPDLNLAVGYEAVDSKSASDHVVETLASNAADATARMCPRGFKIIGCQAISADAQPVTCSSACFNLDASYDTMETDVGRNELEAFINSVHKVTRNHTCSMGVRKVECK